MRNKTLTPLIILILIFTGSLLIVHSIRGKEFSSELNPKLYRLPLEFSEWQGKDLPLEEKVYSILQTRDIIFREYRSGKKERVWLIVVYCANNRAGFHPPELCYKGGSLKMLEQGRDSILLEDKTPLLVNRLLMADSERRLLVYYWFTAGKKNFVNYYRQQLNLIVEQILQGRSYGTLVRVSTLVEDGNYAEAKKRLEKFCQDLVSLSLDTYFSK